jgi:hypothetical protein
VIPSIEGYMPLLKACQAKKYPLARNGYKSYYYLYMDNLTDVLPKSLDMTNILCRGCGRPATRMAFAIIETKPRNGFRNYENLGEWPCCDDHIPQVQVTPLVMCLSYLSSKLNNQEGVIVDKINMPTL